MPNVKPIRETVAIAMSGGVDSSTVAGMLKSQGYSLVGLTMQLWNQRRLAGKAGMPEAVRGRCCSLDDVYDARRVAEKLDIPYYVVNYEEKFEQEVVRNFVDQYLKGETPVPCSLCNSTVKFEHLLTTARQIGARWLATGHYARVSFNAATGKWELRRAVDTAKDQTFFLWGLSQEQLAHTLFPLGEFSKPEVRTQAAEMGLAVASKKDSYEICFVPGNEYQTFLQAYLEEQGRSLPDSAGELVDSEGKVLATHSGIHHFTVGQRKGLGVATGNPLYVLQIHPSEKRVVVGGESQLYGSELTARDVSWVSGEAPNAAVRVQARIRNRHTPADAVAEPLSRGRIRVVFDEPQRAITPGQAVVLYDGELVLGGGWIEKPGLV